MRMGKTDFLDPSITASISRSVVPFDYGVRCQPRGTYGAEGVSKSARDRRPAGAAIRMSQQQETRSSSLVMGAAPPLSEPPLAAIGTGPPPVGVTSHASHRIPRWLERTELFVRVLLRMYLGLAVCFAPWSRGFWDQNPLFVHHPTLAIYAANGTVRGLVSGLGLLNLWIAFSDALHKRSRENPEKKSHGRTG